MRQTFPAGCAPAGGGATRRSRSATMTAMAGVMSAHQERAGALAAHGLDLLAGDALGEQAGDEHLEAVGGRGVAGLTEVGAEDEVLRAHRLDARGGVGERDARGVAHPL